MSCNCNKPKCDGKCGISPSVLQINNPGDCTLFHRVEVPASMGNSITNPPKNGDYRNVLLYYVADGTSWLFSSDGIPQKLVSGFTDYEDAINLPSINGVTLFRNKTGEELGLQDKLTAGDGIEISSNNTISISDIEQYAHFFDTVADMQAATNLVAGSFAKTASYYTVGDGGGALYYITDTEPSTYYETVGDLYAQLIVTGNRINAASYGIKGDGTFDDATAIQAAIDDACKYIQARPTSTGAFGAPITVVLPDKKMYIKTQISTNEAIKIVGGGTSSTLVLADDISYMIKVDKDANTKTRNEETQIEGLEISNLRFDGSSRGYTCTSAIGVYHCDHFVLRDLWFMCIKGKCIELAGAREGNVESIFTRFCGVYGSGCIEIVTNPSVGGDTSNLNFGNNWNIVFPFGAAIKFVDGEFSYVNNILIHGMFDGIINSLSTYFGTNDYNDTNNDFIVLNNSNATFTNLESTYAPDKSVYFKLTNATGRFNNGHLGAHKSTQESHGGDGNFFNLSTNSTMYVNNVRVTAGFQSPDIFVVDGTSKVEGYLNNHNEGYLNTEITDFKRASKFVFEGERSQPSLLGYRDSLGYENITSGDKQIRANMYFGQTEPDDTLVLNQKAMYIGTNVYRSRTIVGIPDEGYFVLPQCNMSSLSYTANHAIFFDENDNLKVMLYDSNSSSWVIKTITLS